jgi:hypothetical protein
MNEVVEERSAIKHLSGISDCLTAEVEAGFSTLYSLFSLHHETVT